MIYSLIFYVRYWKAPNTVYWVNVKKVLQRNFNIIKFDACMHSNGAVQNGQPLEFDRIVETIAF